MILHVRALRSDIDIALRCDPEWIAIYHSVSDIHLQHKLRISREDAIRRSVDAVEYAKAHGLKLRFTLEDASRADPEFLRTVCKELEAVGVDRISVPDTVGIMRPQGMYNLVKTVRETVNVPLDFHCHNDLGLALAHSLSGLEAGASQIHVTIDGLGERVGIVSLAEAVMALKLIYGLDLKVRYEMLRELSELVQSYTGIRTPPSKPVVGDNAYRHKAGTHVAAVIRNPEAYEVIHPSFVGNKRRVIFGELSGKNGAAFLLRVLGLNPRLEDAEAVAKGLKSLRCGDLFELTLTEELEKEAVRLDESVNRMEVVS
ncbi:MAG: 2-isopropylmalate synthase [Nitrososphaerota archaeon]